MVHTLRCAIFFWSLLLASGVGAQPINFPPGETDENAGAPLPPADTLQVLSVDTSDIYLFYAENPAYEYLFQDTLLEAYFTQFDPIRQQAPFLGNLGNPGSPYQPLFFEPAVRRGFDTGFRQFDRYRIEASRLPFYRLTQAFTRASFFQGPTQENIKFSLDFSRNFGKGTNLMLQLNRMNHQGLYEFQRALHNNFGVGLWNQAANGRYQSSFTFAINNSEHQDNGGITAIPTDINGQPVVLSPLEVDVEVSSAETNFTSQEFAFQHHYQFRTAVDSTGRGRRALSARHSFDYQTSTYKFFDEQATSNATYYGPFLSDTRGIRQFVRHRMVRNYVSLYTYTPLPKDSTGRRSERDHLEAGIEHTWHQIFQEPLDSNIQNLFVRGRWHTRFGPNISLTAQGHLGLWDNAGDYLVDGQLTLDLQQAGRLSLHALQQLFTPNLIQYRLVLTQEQIWENDFRKTLETRIGGTYTLPKGQVSVGGSFVLINNLIYFDTAGVARQTGIPVSIPQVQASLPLRWRQLHWENEIYWQQPTETTVRLPRLFGNSSLFFEGMLFKKVMLTRTGLNLRWTAPYQANGYLAPSGQFYQREEELPWQPILDAFVSFKVSKFRFLFRLENVLPPLTQQYYFLTADHPIPQLFLRFGISWEFTD